MSSSDGVSVFSFCMLKEFIVPQPLPRNFDGEIRICNSNDSPSKHRPELALMAMSVIAEWSILDSWLATAFVLMLGEHAEFGVAVITKLTGGAARRTVHSAAADACLTADERIAHGDLMTVIACIRRERNHFAHGLWGHADKLPDAVLILDPEDLTLHDAKHAFNPSDAEFPINKLVVYRKADFENLSLRINGGMRLAKLLGEAASCPQQSNLRKERFALLTQQPEILEVANRRVARAKTPGSLQ